MTRPNWVNLNGRWDYAILPSEVPFPKAYPGSIRVPFPVESALSGVQQPLLPEQKLWYCRTFTDPRAEWGEASRVLLHFGAVDYVCEVWVNEKRVGGHRGGYLPFTLDITSALQPGENELLVSAWDPTDTGLQQRGKQVLQPQSIWYTAVSGIWQTVWLEGVPALSIDSLRLTPDVDGQTLAVAVKLRGAADGLRLEAQASLNGENVAAASGDANAPLTLGIPNPQLWAPGHPTLYDLRLRLTCGGETVDEVGSYFAMRKFGLAPDANGSLRFTLNGEPLFLYGPLDQGYFPDGLYTPPSEEAMLFDIEYTRRIGCNLIRKHVKVEPLRWYHACDRLGMIVWQDMPNGGLIDGMLVAGLTQICGFFRRDTRWLKRFGREQESNRDAFREELQGLVDHLYNAACIAVWVPFNESWGQFHARDVAKWLKTYDPTRLVDHASGWFDQGGGDFQSQHIYFKKLKRPTPNGRAFVLSEFGGYSLKTSGHVWDETKKFGYRFYDTPEALTQAYLDLLENGIKPLIPQGLAAAVYTETTDVEIEINGYLTYDRKVEKMDAGVLRKAHEKLIDFKNE
jgi:beta-galactosidase/beta-glucuronidase